MSPYSDDDNRSPLPESDIGQTGRMILLLTPDPHAPGNNRKSDETSSAIILLHWVAVSTHFQCSMPRDQSQVQVAK
jgi:hypothetical protein